MQDSLQHFAGGQSSNPIETRSIIEAIREGHWDYEPEDLEAQHYRATGALPGSDEKLEILARRVEQGLPLWHDEDCQCYEDLPESE